MGRNKIKIEYIQSVSNRRVTFRKRWLGLQKKAKQLSILAGCEILIIVKPYDAHNDSLHKWIELSSKQPSNSLVQEYMEAKYHGQVQVLDFDEIQEEDEEVMRLDYPSESHSHSHSNLNQSTPHISHSRNETTQPPPIVYEPSPSQSLQPPSSPLLIPVQPPIPTSSLPLAIPEKKGEEQPSPLYQVATSPHFFFPNSLPLHPTPFPLSPTPFSPIERPYDHVLTDYPIFFPPGSSDYYE